MYMYIRVYIYTMIVGENTAEHAAIGVVTACEK